VAIGDNVIIATGSTVSKNIPSGEVWGGVPAKFIMKTETFLDKHKKNISENNDRFRYID
jgi:acetyltransferase-like isoleucine patch superfamily enzyme